MEFSIKAPEERRSFSSGMVRGTNAGKVKYLLTRDGPMFERWAQHLTTGAVIYGDRNWMQANGPEELERFRESADRHFQQWLRGDRDEDHAAAVFFNINGAEYVRDQMSRLNYGGRESSLVAVDWDGTLVEQVWPAEGDWLPGAQQFLHMLQYYGYHVVIYSTRVAPYSYEDWLRPVEDSEVNDQVQYIRRMLDDAGFSDIPIHVGDPAGKLSAEVYVDDKAVQFFGDFGEALFGVLKMAPPQKGGKSDEAGSV